MADTVRLEHEGRVAILTIHRPDKLNVLNHEVGREPPMGDSLEGEMATPFPELADSVTRTGSSRAGPSACVSPTAPCG